MEFDRCDLCIDTRRLGCDALRALASTSLEVTADFDADRKAKVTLDIANTVAKNISYLGCELSVFELKNQLVE